MKISKFLQAFLDMLTLGGLAAWWVRLLTLISVTSWIWWHGARNDWLNALVFPGIALGLWSIFCAILALKEAQT